MTKNTKAKTPAKRALSPLEMLRDSFYIRRAPLLELLQMSNASLYRHINAGTFPKPLHSLGVRTVVWRTQDVREWLAARDAEHGEVAA